MLNGNLVPGIDGMVTMSTSEYRKLVEDRMLHELSAKKFEREKNSRIEEIDELRELLEQTKNELETVKAENNELKHGLTYWYEKCKQLSDEKGDGEPLHEDIETVIARLKTEAQKTDVPPADNITVYDDPLPF